MNLRDPDKVLEYFLAVFQITDRTENSVYIKICRQGYYEQLAIMSSNDHLKQHMTNDNTDSAGDNEPEKAWS